jgi:hypothetical protein
MEVDREGNLWVFDRHTGDVSLISPAGETRTSVRVSGSSHVAADSALGVAALSGDGLTLEVFAWGAAAPARSIPLPERASAICWIGAETVAIAPAMADHDVEIWNAQAAGLVLPMGHEPPLAARPGVVRLRSYELRYDYRKQILYALESFEGHLKAFSIDGKLLKEEKVDPGERRDIKDWLSNLDREGQSKQQAKTPSITWFRLALDKSGTPWIVESCDRTKNTATFVAFSAAGALRRTTVAEPNCSRALAIWGDSLILYRDSGDPPGAHTVVRRLRPGL